MTIKSTSTVGRRTRTALQADSAGTTFTTADLPLSERVRVEVTDNNHLIFDLDGCPFPDADTIECISAAYSADMSDHDAFAMINTILDRHLRAKGVNPDEWFELAHDYFALHEFYPRGCH